MNLSDLSPLSSEEKDMIRAEAEFENDIKRLENEVLALSAEVRRNMDQKKIQEIMAKIKTSQE